MAMVMVMESEGGEGTRVIGEEDKLRVLLGACARSSSPPLPPEPLDLHHHITISKPPDLSPPHPSSPPEYLPYRPLIAQC